MIRKILCMILCALVIIGGMVWLLPEKPISDKEAREQSEKQLAELSKMSGATADGPEATGDEAEEKTVGEVAKKSGTKVTRSDDVMRSIEFLNQYAYGEMIDSSGTGFGCLPVAMTIILNYIQDVEVHPVDLCRDTMPMVLQEHGGQLYEVGDCADHYGLKISDSFTVAAQEDFDKIVNALNDHQLVLLYINSNYVHASSHHFNVAFGINTAGEMQIAEVSMGREEDYDLAYMRQCIDAAWIFETPLKTTVTLEDQTSKYTGEPISMKEVVVSGSEGSVLLTYYLDEDCKKPTDPENSGALAEGTAPAEPGIYYVRARVKADDTWPKGVSRTAKLEVTKKSRKK